MDIQSIYNIEFDISRRTDHFFQKRDISRNKHFIPSRPKSLEYDDNLRLKINSSNNQTIHLHLHPNYDLFHPDSVLFHYNTSSPLIPSNYRVYQGYTVDPIYSDQLWSFQNISLDEPGVLGWARITVRNDREQHDINYPLFEGVFTMYDDTYIVRLIDNYHLTKRSDDASIQSNGGHMVMYRDSDLIDDNSGVSKECGFDTMHHVKMYYPTQSSLFKRTSTSGCPKTKKILYMGVAIDCTYIQRYGSQTQARIQIIQNWNSVSGAYLSAFNVAIGLINITVMDAECYHDGPSWNRPCSTSYSISQRLSDFSQWRGTIGDDGAGLWHLMTDCATGPEVGLAWLSQLCNTKAVKDGGMGQGYTSGTGVSAIIRDEWKVVAHEIGHGFGAIHDCNSITCPCVGSSCRCCPFSDNECDAKEKFFMNPTSNSTATEFSPCSINMVCSQLSNHLSCLHDPGTRNTAALQMCGNGIKEVDEDCDTGGKDSTCCNSKTCKFKNGAVCDDFSDPCCNNCQLRPHNYTCRNSISECDIPEFCSGETADCPKDTFKPDLTSCGDGLQCASGHCTSRDAQCASRGITMGSTRACSGIGLNINSCQIACSNPLSNQCYIYNGFFIDGTPCGIGGLCKSGTC
ncbi:zincin, partial [Backusella circina FSU 941]